MQKLQPSRLRCSKSDFNQAPDIVLDIRACELDELQVLDDDLGNQLPGGGELHEEHFTGSLLNRFESGIAIMWLLRLHDVHVPAILLFAEALDCELDDPLAMLLRYRGHIVAVEFTGRPDESERHLNPLPVAGHQAEVTRVVRRVAEGATVPGRRIRGEASRLELGIVQRSTNLTRLEQLGNRGTESDA